MGNERQKSTVSNSKSSKIKKEETDSDDDFTVSKASKVRKEETDSDDDFKPKSKKSAAVSNAKTSKVKKIKNEDLEDDIKDEKKRKKKEGIEEAEKKAPRAKGKVKKERKVYELPGQKHDPPAERDPLRIFYESLYEQVPTSEMAAIWMMEWGLLPLDVAKKVFEKKQGQKVKSPVKSTSSKRNTASPAKKTPLLSTKKTSSAAKIAVKAITQRKRRANSDSDDDDDEFTISRIKAKRQKITS